MAQPSPVYDGDHTTAFQVGVLRISRPIKNAPNHFVCRARFRQTAADFVKLDFGTAGPVDTRMGSQATYLVDETELEDTDVAGVVEWDRVWATIPGDRDEPGSVVKNYQGAEYVFGTGSPPPILDESIISWSAAIKCNINHHYFRGSAPSVSVIPVLMLASFSNGQKALYDLGTGFPTGTVNGVAGLFTDNRGNSAISCEIEPYMGDIFVRKLITG